VPSRALHIAAVGTLLATYWIASSPSSSPVQVESSKDTIRSVSRSGETMQNFLPQKKTRTSVVDQTASASLKLAPGERLRGIRTIHFSREKQQSVRLKKYLDSSPHGFSHELGKHRWLPDLLAILESDLPLNLEINIIKRSRGYVFFERPEGEIPDQSLPVVLNESDQELAFLTGVLSVKLGDIRDKVALESDFDLQIVQAFDPIRVTLYQAGRQDPRKLFALLARLRQDPRVEKVELEIRDNKNAPQ